MKYFIVSEEDLDHLQDCAVDFGIYQGSSKTSFLIELNKARLEAKRKEIPDDIDIIVGYSSPNPEQLTIWQRETDKIERMKDHDE